MLKRILDKLEDPKRPLLGPNVKVLEFLGLLLPKNKKMKFFYWSQHIILLVFLITEYVEIWFVRSDIKVLLRNLEITMLATVSNCNAWMFLIWQKDWRRIIDYVTKADLNQRDTEDRHKLTKIQHFTRLSRKLTYIYWSLMGVLSVVCICTPICKYFLSKTYREGTKNGTTPYIEVISAWVPFDKKTMKGYLVASFYQSYSTIFGGGRMPAFDTLAMVIMIFFRTELELLRMDAAKIFEKKNKEEIKRRIKSCLKRHTEFVKFFRLFNSCVTHVLMFYFMFGCAVMICVTIYQLSIETVAMQKLISVQLVFIDIAQMFMYCWLSNHILYAILKAAYSYYSILNNEQIK